MTPSALRATKEKHEPPHACAPVAQYKSHRHSWSASSDEAKIRSLFHAGADVFRLNFSHGTHAEHKARYQAIRVVEAAVGQPIAVLLDLQGPKLRLGRFANGREMLEAGQRFRLDLDAELGDSTRAPLPHPEIFSAVRPGNELLIDDGKLRLRISDCGPDHANTIVINGGVVSDRKGVNVPGALLPLSALTEKDRLDLAFGLELGVDWVALPFVQRPEDIVELQGLMDERVGVMAKLEKPSAIEQPLPFPDRSFQIVIASLCLHYFAWNKTVDIVREIHRCLPPGGLLLCRVNSTKDIDQQMHEHLAIESNFYRVKGKCSEKKRYFDRAALTDLFSAAWEFVAIEEMGIDRYDRRKMVWEIVLKKSV